MHDGPVVDDAIVAHYSRVAGIGVPHAAVLDVGSGADPDLLRVPPQHRPVPDALLLPEMYISDYVPPRRDHAEEAISGAASPWGSSMALLSFRSNAAPAPCS